MYRFGARISQERLVVRCARACLCIGAIAAVAADQAVERASADWPIFRGNAALHGVAAGECPADLELRWTFAAEKPIVSSPIIVDGRVYVGSDDGHLYCVNVEDGTTVWETPLGDVIEAPPFFHRGVVYVGSHDFFFYAVDAQTGAVRWKHETDERIVGGANAVSNAAGTSTYIVVGSHDNFLYAFDPASGAVKWSLETNDRINATPAVVGTQIVFGGCDTIVYAVEGMSGTVQQRIELGGDCHIAGSVAVDDGHVYFGHNSNQFLRLNLADGAKAWSYERANSGFFGAPALTKDRVVFAGRDRLVHCVRRDDGSSMWTFPSRRKIDASPVVWGDSVIVGSADGRLYVLALSDGTERWSYDIGKSIYSSPAIGNGLIVVGANDGRLYAFGAPAASQ